MTQPITKKPYTVAAMRHGGTHLITPIVRKFTDRPVYSPKGAASLNCIPSDVVIVFLRDPRNRAVSNLRYKLGPPSKDMTREERDAALWTFLQSRKGDAAMTIIDFMQRWAQKWRAPRLGVNVKHATVVRFEDLAGANSLAEITRIGQFLAQAGAKLVSSATEARDYALGKSGTWTGSHSNYREWFGPRATDYWRRNFGPDCTRAMGYQLDEVLGI